MAATLPSFPEELLERILAHAVIAPAAPHPRASWHSPSPPPPLQPNNLKQLNPHAGAPPPSSSLPHSTASPSPSSTTPSSCTRPVNPRASSRRCARDRFWCTAVRVLVLASPSAGDAGVLGVLMLSGGKQGWGAGCYVAVERKRRPRPVPCLMLWRTRLLTAPNSTPTTLTFPLSTDPALLPLANALSTAPALTTLRTPLPALPNAAPAYALVAENESLQRVCLGDDIDVPPLALPAPAPALVEEECANAKELLPVPSRSPRRATCSSGSVVPSSSPSSPRAARPILPTSLFLSAARPHDRLCELIRAGTHVAVVRARRAVEKVHIAIARRRRSFGWKE
ncbi:hypothetical protein R3P38DRAFT_3562514 [Favolaschia claudopus]|uniref:Uncharacterized protein n=1 Tax=Favolaschia claudopus TaxID=2862362 RepID=A0AAW0AU10_9AGAR